MKRPFSEADWLTTPEPVSRYVESLEQRIEQLETAVALLLPRVEQQESRLKQNSQNSTSLPLRIRPISGPSGREEKPSVVGVAKKVTRAIGNRC